MKGLRHPARTFRAFSLVEVLMVVFIIILVLGLAFPAVQSLANGYQLAGAGSHVAGLLERARMHATSTQRVATVRFYPDLETKDPDEGFRYIQIFETVPFASGVSSPPFSTVTKAITRGIKLEKPVLISSVHSSALRNSDIIAGTDALAGINALPYLEFYFFPNGSASLAAESPNPYLTLVLEHDEEALKNPLVVSLDPVTGRSTIFRR